MALSSNIFGQLYFYFLGKKNCFTQSSVNHKVRKHSMQTKEADKCFEVNNNCFNFSK